MASVKFLETPKAEEEPEDETEVPQPEAETAQPAEVEPVPETAPVAEPEPAAESTPESESTPEPAPIDASDIIDPTGDGEALDPGDIDADLDNGGFDPNDPEPTLF